MNADNINKKTMAEDIAQRIMQLIIDREVQPGEKIPTETELISMLGASRSTIREGTRILVAKNILESRRGSGTYLSKKCGVADDPLGLSLELDKAKTAYDLMEIRKIIEPHVAMLAALQRSYRDLEKLISIHTKMAELSSHLDEGDNDAEYISLDHSFHESLALCSGNTIMGKLVPILHEGIQVMQDMQTMQRNANDTIEEHETILGAIKAKDPLAAKDAMSFHLMMSEKYSQIKRY